MPSKKKLRKQLAEAQRTVNLFSDALARCTRAWERQEALFESAIDQAEADVRSLLEDIGEPAFYDGTHEAGRVRAMRDRYGFPREASSAEEKPPAVKVASGARRRTRSYTDQDHRVWTDTSDWADTLPDEAPKLAQAVSTVKKAQFGEPGTILHNHDFDPTCRETVRSDGTRRGECLGDAA
jgi:hypothetical protein